MNIQLYQLLKGKNILILGFGREGQSTYKLIRSYFQDIKLSLADSNPGIKDHKLIRNDKNLNLNIGKDYLQFKNEYNLIFKTPGIPAYKLPSDISLSHITSQADVFLQMFSPQIIGITGTKGKSTTSSLIYSILKAQNDNVFLAGNIGIPPFDLIGSINRETRIVYELSCHQLGNVSSSPHISILLNLYREHLDYYKTYQDYKLAKYNIHRFQKPDDYFIFNSDSEEILSLISENSKSSGSNKSQCHYFSFSFNQVHENSCYIKNNKIIYNEYGNEYEAYDLNNKPQLKGEHNLLNIMASIAACRLSGVNFDVMADVIKNFKGLKHRLEYVGEYGGIEFYNDSIATIPEATIQAIEALKKVDTLILGGYDRGIIYTHLIEYLIKSSVRNIIFLGNAGERMYNEFKSHQPSAVNQHLFPVSDMTEAVKVSGDMTRKSGICLLSPAAASYGMFKDFEERGNTFIRLVTENLTIE